MMNLLARILSHGFAIAIVLLLAIGLIYRGELFPDWKLPEFLTLGTQTDSEQADSSAPGTPEAAADTAGMEATPVEAATEEEAVLPYEEIPPGDMDAPEYTPPAEEPETPEASDIPQVPAASAVAVEPAMAPETTLYDTSAADTTAEEETGTPEAAPMEAPATDTTEPVLEEPAPEPQAVDDTGMAPVLAVPETAPEVAMPEVAVPEVAVPEAAVPETEVPVVTVPEVAVPEAAMPEEVAAEQPVTLPASLAEPEPEPEMARQAVPTKPASMPVPAATVDLPVTEAAAPVEPYMAAPSRAKPAADNAYQLLAAAREAYWLRDYETAESKYRELLALQPDNPDGYGELGNMYFSQGMWEQSASAYFDAGTRLVKEGQLEQARQLVDVIRGLDGSQADELNTLINENQAATH
jgi:hypothetical protein